MFLIKIGLILINLIVFIVLLKKKRTIPIVPLLILFILCMGASWLYLIYKPYRYMDGGGDMHLVDYPHKYFFFIQAVGFFALMVGNIIVKKTWSQVSAPAIIISFIVLLSTFFYLYSNDVERLSKEKYDRHFWEKHP